MDATARIAKDAQFRRMDGRQRRSLGNGIGHNDDAQILPDVRHGLIAHLERPIEMGQPAVEQHYVRGLLDGIELADSLSFDPHKWLFQPIECGCVLLRDAGLLKAAYRIMPEYLADVHRNVAEVNPCDYGIQLTRGFRALKVWMSISYFGMESFRAAVERGFELAEVAEKKLRSMANWEVVTPAQMGVVCFRRRDVDEGFYPKMHNAMLKDGFALATSTVLNGRTVLRLCTINPRTTDADVEQTLDWLDTLADQIR